MSSTAAKENFYERIRARITAWAKTKDGRQSPWLEYVLVLPDFFYLICGLLTDSRVPARHKATLGIVLAYMVSPFDLIPEGVIGPGGFIDDVALCAYALSGLLKHVDEAVLLAHWKGRIDLLKLIRQVLGAADQMVGPKTWRRLQNLLRRKRTTPAP